MESLRKIKSETCVQSGRVKSETILVTPANGKRLRFREEDNDCFSNGQRLTLPNGSLYS